MQCSGLQVAAFLILLAGTILIAISISTDSWSKRTLGKAGVAGIGQAELVHERGLWRECTRVASQGEGSLTQFNTDHEKCNNRYSKTVENFKKLEAGEDPSKAFEDLHAWEVAVLALMAGSGFFGILSLLFSPCCCNRCGCCLATFVFFAGSLCAAAVCTYAYYVSTSGGAGEYELKWNEFGWSFWCGVAGGALQFFSGILFAVSRCRQHSYSQTI